jgi:hypothetical protein
MRHLIKKAVFMAAVLLLAETKNAQAQYNYTTLPFEAYGISGDNIVGRDFIYNLKSQTYTGLTGPSAPLYAQGISGSNVVGYYYIGSTAYGFLFTGSSYSTLNVPGAIDTYAYGISGTNIVGYSYNGTNYSGFLYNGTSYITLNVPGAVDTLIYGIDGNNFVGLYNTGAGAQAFLYNGSSYITLGVPGALETQAFGISGTNIVGTYNSQGAYGFFYNGSGYTALAVPGAEYTYAYGISGNNIVGGYWNGSSYEGFLATRVPPPTIVCPAPLVFECENGSADGTVQVTVQESNDIPVQVVWTVDDVPYQTNNIPAGGAITSTNLTLTATFGTGEHAVGVSASNGQAAPATCSTTVTVNDTVPPQIVSIAATPNVLWPPNKRMIPVNVRVDAVDNCDPSPVAKIIQVTSNKPENLSVPDWEFTGPLSVNLRADRLGTGEGRIYTIQVQCEDASGNVSYSSVNVTVPHDKK